MKNIIKTLVVMLSSVSLFASANAGELGVSGTAKATYNILSGKTNVGKGIGITNELNFTASGELDNGYTWSYSMELDPTDAANGGTATNDDTKLTLTTPYGTFGAFVLEGGLDLEDGASQSVYARPTDMGDPSNTTDNFTIDSYNNIQYHTPADALPFGITAKIAHAPSMTAGITDYKATGAANAVAYDAPGTGTGFFNTTADPLAQKVNNLGDSATHYQVTIADLGGFVEGLTLGADYLDISGQLTSEQEAESGSYYGTYKAGMFSLGYSKSYLATMIQGTGVDALESIETTKYSIAANINDDFSISYEKEKSEPNTQTAATSPFDLESTGIQAAYTMGGMTLAVAMNDHQNARYTENMDVKDTTFSVAMAF